MDAHELGGSWLLREMWDFPSGVPEDDGVDYLKAIMACARAGTDLSEAERSWVIGYGAACGARQATVDALEAYDADEDVVEISVATCRRRGCGGGSPCSTLFEHRMQMARTPKPSVPPSAVKRRPSGYLRRSSSLSSPSTRTSRNSSAAGSP